MNDPLDPNRFEERVQIAISSLQRGSFVILMDDVDRENEGDLVLAGEKVTPEAINFMARYGRGLICVPMTKKRVEDLGLPLMSAENTAIHKTAFTVSVDAIKGTATGISAYDRSVTIRALVDENTKPSDLARPGHVFPLRAEPGGVLRRVGQTEGSVDLCKLAGLKPIAVVCEIMKDDGTMARLEDLTVFSSEHSIPIVHVKDIVKYRLKRESLVQRVDEATLPTEYGLFQIIGYHVPLTGEQHVALVLGELSPEEPVLVRVHSQCLTGDVLGSLRCDCGAQLKYAMRIVAEEGRGVLLYLMQEGRGIGLMNKIRAYHLQDEGMDTVEANLELGFPPDMRDYGIGAQILRDIGVRKIRVITNNPRKMVGLEAYGIEIVERVPIPNSVIRNEINENYLQTKAAKLGHLICSD